ncbi:hypothetical protein ACLMJK_007807 [Lecanora helva]
MTAVARPAPVVDTTAPNQTEIAGNHTLDTANDATALPSGLKLISAERYGTSAWSATASITTRAQDGTEVRFFVKYATGDHGSAQLQGEFKGMQEISKTVPGLAPKPYHFGKLDGSPAPTFFFLCEFVNITNNLPDPKALGARLA